MTLRRCFAIVALSVCASTMASIAVAVPLPSDANLLLGKPVASSSEFTSTTYTTGNAVNGLAGGPGAGYDFVFAMNNSDQRLSVHGFNSNIGLFRLWTGGDLRPKVITMRSSTTDQASLTAANYETILLSSLAIADGSWIQSGSGDGIPGNFAYYVDLPVSAPSGTKSLWFDFGTGTTSGNTNFVGFTRIGEIQAFAAAVPEPASWVLFMIGALSLFAVARRQSRS